MHPIENGGLPRSEQSGRARRRYEQPGPIDRDRLSTGVDDKRSARRAGPALDEENVRVHAHAQVVARCARTEHGVGAAKAENAARRLEDAKMGLTRALVPVEFGP